jgi:YVTN family beta-propeller protein
MPPFRWFVGLWCSGWRALVGVVPAGASAVPARSRCRSTAFVANSASGTVSTIDTKTRTKDPTDITVGSSTVRVGLQQAWNQDDRRGVLGAKGTRT